MPESELVHQPMASVFRIGQSWDWREPHRGEHFRRCDYCGSIHPDDLVKEIPGVRPEWADQKYGWPHKVYVDIPDRLGELSWLGGISGGEKLSDEVLRERGYTPVGQLSRAEKKACKRDGVKLDSYQGVMVTTRSVRNAKFYSVHLRDPAISDETKATIFEWCGLRFEWDDDGGVRWGRPDSLRWAE